MRVKDLDIGMLTTHDISVPEECQRFFDLIRAFVPEFWPERYDSVEPLRKRFTTVESAKAEWKRYFFWKRKRPSVDGAIFFGERDEHHAVYIRATQAENSLASILEFVGALASAWRPEFGYIYPLQQAENVSDTERAVMPFRRGVVTRDLATCIPDLPWVTVFGGQYLERIGIDRMMSAPVFAQRRLAPDVVMLCVVDEAAVRTGGAELTSRVAQVRRHLGPELFCVP